MAIVPVRKPIDADKIYVNGLTCQICEKTFNTHLRGTHTRKLCPKCVKGTFIIEVTPMRGYIHVGVMFVDEANNISVVEISPEQVEVDDSPE